MTQKSRKNARSEVTSVAVSKEFKEFMNFYKISPTDVFRKGMGIILYEEGVEIYNTPLNRKRLEGAKRILGELKEIEENIKLLKRLKKSIEELEGIYYQLNSGGTKK